MEEIIKSCLSSNIGDVCLLTRGANIFSNLGILFSILIGFLIILPFILPFAIIGYISSKILDMIKVDE